MMNKNKILKLIEQKILWLACWMIHNANHLRSNDDGLKVGGHQASSASIVSIMTALYFDILRPEDRVAVKPHASPVFHAIQYLSGLQTKENIENFRGFGVSACATCDGFFFKDKKVAVVGGGNAAVEEAMFLTKFASKVQLIHRRDSLRAEKMLQKKLMDNKKIEIIWDTVVEEVIGDKDPKNVTGLKIKNVKTNENKELKIDGLFIAIGHDPATELFKNQLEMDKEGYLITKPDSTQTNVPGVFAAGDVKDKIFRQAVTAAGMGCMAALEAEKHLSK